MLDVLDDEADRCGPLPPPETPSDIVGSISESATASRTRAVFSALTPGSSFTTRETVFRLTPATLATSTIVGDSLIPLLPSPTDGRFAARAVRQRCHQPKYGPSSVDKQ